jgi:hypothetical protein
MPYTVEAPQIDAVEISENPTTINHYITISISVSEITRALGGEDIFAGEFSSGTEV